MADIHETRTADHHEQVKIHEHEEHQHSVQVVEDQNASRRLVVSRIANFIWLFVGILVALIAFRIILELLVANPNNPIANFIYSITDLVLWPFSGLTITPSMGGMVLDIPAIIAMFVYALLGCLLSWSGCSSIGRFHARCAS
ncbi:MAG: YggT family protein [Anaerolineales bacterium]